MAIQVINPENEAAWLKLRAQDITSTEVAALFGVSPYCTLFELWHRKRDQVVVEIESNERMKWGNRLQDAIAEGIAKDQGWQVRRMTEYMRDDQLRMGASFDFAIDAGGPLPGPSYKGKDYRGLLEIKNVDSLAFQNGWAEDDAGNIEAPPHIEIQVQHQLAVSGRAFCYIGALVGGNRLVLIKREPDAKIIDAIKSQVASFWFTIASGKEPVPDFSRDAKFIARLYGYADPGKIFDARGDAEIAQLASRYRELGNAIKEAETQREGIKAQLLLKIGDAEKVTGDGFSINAGVQGPTWIEAYERKGFRTFRVNWKRVKETV